MRRSIAWLFLMACSGPPPPAQDVVAPPPIADELVVATARWRAAPDEARRDAVIAIAERATVQPAHPALDVALGDALSNVALRPDLGVPYLERHVAAPDEWRRDVWLDALLRSHDLSRLAIEIRRLTSLRVDADHPSLTAAAHQAQSHPSIHWRDAVDAYRSATLVELGLAQRRRAFDTPVRDVGALLAVLGVMFEGWNIEVATSRTSLPDDPDPLLTPGMRVAANGRRVVVGYANSADPVVLGAPGRALDDGRLLRASNIVARLHAPTGGQVLMCLEGRYEHGELFAVSSSDPERTGAWVEAAQMWIEAGSPPDMGTLLDSRAAVIRGGE
jgi:hypothetical protein